MEMAEIIEKTTIVKTENKDILVVEINTPLYGEAQKEINSRLESIFNVDIVIIFSYLWHLEPNVTKEYLLDIKSKIEHLIEKIDD